MKKDKVIYWIATGIVSVMMVMSGLMYFMNPEVAEGFTHLGFPGYFRMELGVAKLVGATVLLVPQFPQRVKEWAYAGFGITFISAAIAQTASGDTGSVVAGPVIFLALLVVSRIYLEKMAETKVAVAA
ncbi:DoxX family protein [uncultured Imperialibacter sp.]|uniref:DoxX family protein n=1 Tax=uncultured Imperialibacter sp. TaxID=1672639 RepID=UPI0030DCAB6B|tara:strand:+ start:660 stop:1043 length:384 start_codon:yes stop_codon:yes gene_type:complete